MFLKFLFLCEVNVWFELYVISKTAGNFIILIAKLFYHVNCVLKVI